MTFSDLLNSKHKEEAIERAGIMQYDAEMNKFKAEIITAQLLTKKYGGKK